jgi:uncharacterized membrane protein YfcA
MVKATPKTPIMNYARSSFGFGLGFLASYMLFIFLGMLFFIPGLYLMRRERAKPVEQRDRMMQIIGFVLMIIGAVFGLGMGFGILGDSIGDIFE